MPVVSLSVSWSGRPGRSASAPSVPGRARASAGRSRRAAPRAGAYVRRLGGAAAGRHGGRSRKRCHQEPTWLGVRVGHTTLIRGDNVRTGVTAILPHEGNLFQEKVPAAIFVGNGFGKLMGSTQVPMNWVKSIHQSCSSAHSMCHVSRMRCSIGCSPYRGMSRSGQ